MIPFIHILGKDIPIYGIMFYFGICCAAVVALILSKKRQIQSYDVVSSAIYVMIGAIIGSKLLFLITSAKQIIEHNIPFVNVIKGGFVFYGGLIGGIIGLYIYLRQYKLPRGDFYDLYSVVLPLGHAFGRIGCFFAGCCYGIKYDGVFSVKYNYSYGLTPIGEDLFPVQLLETGILFALFALQLVLYLKCNYKGVNAITYIVTYPVIRFCLEFLRGDRERGFLINLSISQWISLFLIIIFATYMINKTLSNERHFSIIDNEGKS